MRGAAAVLAFAILLQALGAAAGQGAPVYAAQSLSGAKSLIQLEHAWLAFGAPWEDKPTGQGVRIGLIDTGIDATHPDLQGALCRTCWRDFTSAPHGGAAGPSDDHGHGTHVAGILAGRGHLQPDPLHSYWLTGARGIAPGATLLVAKAMDARGEGADDRVAAAIQWALDPDGDPGTDDGADVINLSIGIAAPGEEEGRRTALGTETRAAIGRAIAAGVPVVASSGNDGEPRLREPGDIPDVITVAAVDAAGRLAAFSNRGAGLDLLAPGILVSTYPLALDRGDFAVDGYAAMAGTSMAAPVVAGTIALLMEADPSLQPGAPRSGQEANVERIERLLRGTALPLAEDGGAAGLVNAQGALQLAGRGGAAAWDGLLALAMAGAFAALAAVLVLRRARGRAVQATAVLPAEPVRTLRTAPLPPAAPPAVATPPPRAVVVRRIAPFPPRPPSAAEHFRSPSVGPGPRPPGLP